MTEHTLIVEKILGHKLPYGAVIHHVDGDGHNNTPSNLVVCPSRSYHQLLHKRQRVVDLGASPNTHKYCYGCKKIVEKDLFYKRAPRGDGLADLCKPCSKIVDKERYDNRTH